MRQQPSGRRPRGRSNRKHYVPHRSQNYDSHGPDVRVRGNAMQVYEKYVNLARDAFSSGDRIAAESYQQYAEHYFRIINDTTDPQRAAPERPQTARTSGPKNVRPKNLRPKNLRPRIAQPRRARRQTRPPAIDPERSGRRAAVSPIRSMPSNPSSTAERQRRLRMAMARLRRPSPGSIGPSPEAPAAANVVEADL